MIFIFFLLEKRPKKKKDTQSYINTHTDANSVIKYETRQNTHFFSGWKCGCRHAVLVTFCLFKQTKMNNQNKSVVNINLIRVFLHDDTLQ